MHPIFVRRGEAAQPIPIWFVTGATYAEVRDRLDPAARAFAEAAGFEPKAGRHLLLPGAAGLSGRPVRARSPRQALQDPFLPGRLPGLLPAGTYRFANAAHDPRLAALAFALGAYRFGRYRKVEDKDGQARASGGRRRRRPHAHRRGRDAGARPRSTRRPTTWARPSWRKPRARSPSGMARACARSWATTCLPRTFR